MLGHRYTRNVFWNRHGDKERISPEHYEIRKHEMKVKCLRIVRDYFRTIPKLYQCDKMLYA